MHVRVDGARLFIDVEGPSLVPDGGQWRERPTVVLLHGGPAADHTTFKPSLSRLGAVAQLVYFDQRGGGRSTKGMPDSWNLNQWTTDLRDLCGVLGIARPILLGQSFGTLIAMRYAIDYPEDVCALVLASPYATGDFSSSYPLFRELGGDDVAEAARDFWETPTPGSLDRYLDLCVSFYSGRRDHGGERQREAVRPRLISDVLLHYAQNEHQTLNLLDGVAKIQCPALLLTGGRDPITPPLHAEAIVARMAPGLGTVGVIAGAGHHVFHEAPDETFPLVEAFIADAWLRPLA